MTLDFLQVGRGIELWNRDRMLLVLCHSRHSRQVCEVSDPRAFTGLFPRMAYREDPFLDTSGELQGSQFPFDFVPLYYPENSSGRNKSARVADGSVTHLSLSCKTVRRTTQIADASCEKLNLFDNVTGFPHLHKEVSCSFRPPTDMPCCMFDFDTHSHAQRFFCLGGTARVAVEEPQFVCTHCTWAVES